MKGGSNNRISFSVASIECIACTPIFKRELQKLQGVRAVRPLVMTNQIIVDFDVEIITLEQMRNEIVKIATKAGLGSKLLFSPA